MSIYTRRGDRGETSLASGARVRKDSARVEAFGAIDEANSWIGLARASTGDEFLGDVLCFAQHRLFNCSSLLASEAAPTHESPALTADDTLALESAIDRFELRSGPATLFVLEAGCEVASRLQVARATVRRAERRVVSLAAEADVAPEVAAFLNRLSDALFAAARYANALADTPDEPWDDRAVAAWHTP